MNLVVSPGLSCLVTYVLCDRTLRFKTHVSSRTFPRFGAQMRFWNFLMRKQNKAIEDRNIPNAFSRTRKMHPVAPHTQMHFQE